MSNHTQKRKQRFKVGTRAIASAILVLLVIAAGLVVSNILGRAQATALGPATVLVTRGRIVGSVSGSGAIAAEQTVDLSFQTSGVVKTVAAAAGDHVQAAQVKIDYSSAMANYNIQVASINDSSVRSAAASLASAKATLAKLQNSPTVQDLQIAQAQLEQAKIALQQAQLRLRNAQLSAPFA